MAGKDHSMSSFVKAGNQGKAAELGGAIGKGLSEHLQDIAQQNLQEMKHRKFSHMLQKAGIAKKNADVLSWLNMHNPKAFENAWKEVPSGQEGREEIWEDQQAPEQSQYRMPERGFDAMQQNNLNNMLSRIGITPQGQPLDHILGQPVMGQPDQGMEALGADPLSNLRRIAGISQKPGMQFAPVQEQPSAPAGRRLVQEGQEYIEPIFGKGAEQGVTKKGAVRPPTATERTKAISQYQTLKSTVNAANKALEELASGKVELGIGPLIKSKFSPQSNGKSTESFVKNTDIVLTNSLKGVTGLRSNLLITKHEASKAGIAHSKEVNEDILTTSRDEAQEGMDLLKADYPEIDFENPKPNSQAPQQGGTRVDELPPASQFPGRKIKDHETGKILTSNGTNWV